MKKNFLYRFLVLLIAYAMIGVIVLSSMAKQSDPVLFWVVAGSLLGLFVISVVVVEILQYRARKNNE